MKKIAVVGGGTAGWLTALWVKHKLKDVEVTLVESSEIGIIGAGEGSTPHLVSFLNEIDIPITDIFKKASGTIKNGILFTNWNKDGDSYFHPFHDEGQLLKNQYQAGKRIAQGKNLNNLVPSFFLIKEKKAKLFFIPEQNAFIEMPPSGIALHFNAKELAEYLKEIGKSRGVRVIDARVREIVGSNEHIKKIILDNGEVLDTDFIFDCSGLHRLIIGKYFNSEWVGLQDNIPNDTAIPFFLPMEQDGIPPYTEAIAMDYGWVWKIPVRNRYGCGYVFDSKKISEEDAKKEIISKFGDNTFPKVFKFSAGYYKEIWKGNCLAVGLASGFIEPLEATSIWNTITILEQFINNLPGIFCEENSKYYRSALNDAVVALNEDIAAFIYFHYCTDKKNTPYWENFREENTPPRNFSEIEKVSNNVTPVFFNMVLPNTFNTVGVLTVGAGIRFFSTQAGADLVKRVELIGTDSLKRKEYLESFNHIVYYVQNCVKHIDYLNEIVNV